MAFGINAQYRFAIFQKHRGGMPQILPGFPIDHHLKLRLIVKINDFQILRPDCGAETKQASKEEKQRWQGVFHKSSIC